MAIIYISSTFQDLQDYRREVSKVLRRMGHTVITMEDYGPSGRPPLNKCLEDVAKCDIYIGIVAWRYGFIPTEDNPDNKSITECEYQHAKKLQKECWIFLLEEKARWTVTLIDTGEQRERVNAFRDELAAKNVVCFFKNREELRQKVKKEVKRRFSRLRAWWAWLTELLPSWPWYVTIPLALVAALLAVTLALAVYYWSLYPKARADFLIKYGIWPERFTDAKEDFFDLPPGTQQNESQCIPPLKHVWSYTTNQWCITSDGFLSVRGRDWGVRNDLGGKALYDLEMRFVVFFEKGNEAAWVVRAQEDKRSGYVFMLQRSRGELFLNGWVYTSDGKQVPLGNTPSNPLNIGKIYDSDHFEIKVTASDNVFSHEVTLQNAADLDEDRYWFGRRYIVPDFKDGENFFSYGTVGFFVPEAGSEISIENFWLGQPSAPASSPS